MGHVFEDFKSCARDAERRFPSETQGDQRVERAVDDEGGRPDLRKLRPEVRRGEAHSEVARDRAVVHAARPGNARLRVKPVEIEIGRTADDLGATKLPLDESILMRNGLRIEPRKIVIGKTGCDRTAIGHDQRQSFDPVGILYRHHLSSHAPD